jgi:hypothetical protein
MGQRHDTTSIDRSGVGKRSRCRHADTPGPARRRTAQAWTTSVQVAITRDRDTTASIDGRRSIASNLLDTIVAPTRHQVQVRSRMAR